MTKESLKWVLGSLIIVGGLFYLRSRKAPLEPLPNIPTATPEPALQASPPPVAMAPTPMPGPINPGHARGKNAQPFFPTPAKRQPRLIAKRGYQVVPAPVSGTFAVKIGDKTVVASFTQVSAYGCPKPNEKKMCLLLPSGEQLEVNEALEPLLPESFRYAVKHR